MPIESSQPTLPDTMVSLSGLHAEHMQRRNQHKKEPTNKAVIFAGLGSYTAPERSSACLRGERWELVASSREKRGQTGWIGWVPGSHNELDWLSQTLNTISLTQCYPAFSFSHSCNLPSHLSRVCEQAAPWSLWLGFCSGQPLIHGHCTGGEYFTNLTKETAFCTFFC